jgi:hypothetical protein
MKLKELQALVELVDYASRSGYADLDGADDAKELELNQTILLAKQAIQKELATKGKEYKPWKERP